MSIKLTMEGKKNIELQLQGLQERLKDVRHEKSVAYTATGDTWHDNPYFNKLEADERAIEIQINELVQILRDAEILLNNERNMEEVGMGSIIKCYCQYFTEQHKPDFDETVVLEIVGHGETDIDNGKIHYESLVAQSLCGHHKNEVIPIKLPNGMSVEYTILNFYADWDDVKEES